MTQSTNARAAAAGLAAILMAAGCSRSASRPQDSTVAAAHVDTPAVASPPREQPMTVTATGYGPLRIGMTVTSAATALAAPVPSTSGLDTACAYVHIANVPPGMRIMIAHDTVTRIDIDSATVATGLGARVGDPETRIRELYGSRVSVQPHKYLPNGHYLTVAPVPPTDSAFRLVFETDGNKITNYHAGRVPQVEWVEGCA